MQGLIITRAGESLLSSVIGGGRIEFTRLCTGARSYSQSQITGDAPTFEAAQSAAVSGSSRSGGVCEVFAALDNSALGEGYYIRAVGVFAKCGADEVLFGVCVEDGDAFYMPAGSENSRTEVTLRVALSALNSSEVCIASGESAYASSAHVREELARIDSRIDSLDFGETIAAKISEHDQSAEAHGDLIERCALNSEEINSLKAKIAVLETAVSTEISSNPFAVTFSNLDGIGVSGIWNKNAERLEF